MLAASDIEAMSVTERLQAIELLWSSMVSAQVDVSSPAWHADVLEARRKKVEAGEGTFLSLPELRARLNASRA